MRALCEWAASLESSHLDYFADHRDAKLPSMLTVRMAKVREILSLIKFSTANTRAGRTYLESMKRGAREVWWYTLHSMQKAAYLKAEAADHAVNLGILRQWSEIGIGFGLDEEKERKRHERDAVRRCAWAGCNWHWSTPGESVKLKQCKGCGEVSYCGRECQRTSV